MMGQRVCCERKWGKVCDFVVRGSEGRFVILLWEEVREGLLFCCERKWGKFCHFVVITCCNAHCATLKLERNNLQIQLAKEVFFNFSNYVVFSYNIITDNTILCLLISITTFILMHVTCIFIVLLLQTMNSYISQQYFLYNIYCYMFRHF
jgi:hypothetical protein